MSAPHPEFTMSTQPSPLLSPAEVANLFRVNTKTVVRWSDAGKLRSVRTLGGHRRFYASEVRALIGLDPAASAVAS